MKITESQLKKIIKEEVEKIKLEEGWKDVAMAGALGLSTLASPSADAQAPQTNYSQVSAASTNSIESTAERLIKYVGPRNTHWLNKRDWDEDSINSETLVAWQEVLSGVENFWTSTLPLQKAGCETNPETQLCVVLEKIADELRSDLNPVMSAVENELDRQAKKQRRISPKLIKKMNNIIDLWVPATKSKSTFLATPAWKKIAKDYKPGETKKGKGTFVPVDDEL